MVKFKLDHSLLVAFARVTEGSDVNRNTTPAGSLSQPYQQLAAFGMQPNPSMFSTTSAVASPSPAHTHQQSR